MGRRASVRDYYEDDYQQDDIYEDDERARKRCRTRMGRPPRGVNKPKRMSPRREA